MAMNATQQASYTLLGTAAGTLVDKMAAFNAAASGKTAADNTFNTAKNDLDAAWSAYKAQDATFDGVVLVAPTGYTPPPA